MASIGLTVALAGNPNSGKTTIFNNLTGARQHVGNYPGVTVEKREGFRKFQDKELLIVDLPGTYSLTANALDELVARNVIINDKPDILVNILDAANLERNLYLAVQLLELEQPVVLALNMADVAEKMGRTIDDRLLEQKLGVPVIRTVGNQNKGTKDLLETVVAATTAKRSQALLVDYGAELEARIVKLTEALESLAAVKYPQRWLALKLLENDAEVQDSIRRMTGGARVLALADSLRGELKAALGEEVEIWIAERRYQFVGTLCQEVVQVRDRSEQTTSDKIDRVLTHRVFGLPLFFAIMWLLFNFVFTMGHYPQEWISDGVKTLGAVVGEQMADGELKSLVADGMIGGVGAVVGFLPQILLLFLGISLLEDTGYMARAAFVMDRVMRAVGLHGKSFIPLLLGFGCNVPAIMGTRTLDNPRDRMVTILVAPLMSCSARLPVYTLLTSAFFAKEIAGSILFSVYLIGISLAVLMALLFRKTLFPGATEAFVMEMPPYHIPTLRSMLTHMWERSVLYLKKAGTLILAASILIWFLTNYPNEVSYSRDFDAAVATAEATFSQQVEESVLTPLQMAAVEDNTELQALIGQIQQVKDSAEEEEAPVARAETVVDASVTDDGQALVDEEMSPQLLALQQANPTLYPYAMTYWKLEDAKKSELEKLTKEKASEKLARSYAGQFGHLIEPAIKPLGFDWKMGVGLVSAVAAKEVLVGTLGTIYSVGDVEDDSSGLQASIAADPSFTPLVAYSLMIFTLIYSPCLAALAVVRRETNSWKWPLFSMTYSTALAWLLSFAVYQIGTLLGF